MAKISELKEMIVELKLDLINANIPYGHCPHAYYHPPIKYGDCGEIDCDMCRRRFMEDMERDIRKEIRKL
jgi:hypothetical protein